MRLVALTLTIVSVGLFGCGESELSEFQEASDEAQEKIENPAPLCEDVENGEAKLPPDGLCIER